MAGDFRERNSYSQHTMDYNHGEYQELHDVSRDISDVSFGKQSGYGDINAGDKGLYLRWMKVGDEIRSVVAIFQASLYPYGSCVLCSIIVSLID